MILQYLQSFHDILNVRGGNALSYRLYTVLLCSVYYGGVPGTKENRACAFSPPAKKTVRLLQSHYYIIIGCSTTRTRALPSLDWITCNAGKASWKLFFCADIYSVCVSLSCREIRTAIIPGEPL